MLPTLCAAAILFRKNRPFRNDVLAGVGAVFVPYLVWMLAILPGLGITGSNPREALSVPIQQLAYTIKHDPAYFEDGVGDEIDALLVEGSTTDTLAEKYKVKKSDPVKKQFRFDNSGEVSAFLNIWWRVGADHPDMYDQALLLHTRGYWNPFMGKGKYCEVNDIGKLYTVASRGTVNEDSFPGTYALHPGAKKLAKSAIDYLWKTPFALLLNPAFYVWASIVAGLALAVRRRPYAVLLVMAVCIIGICCLSPLNGGLRYVFPLCFLAPLLVGCHFISRPTRGNVGGDGDDAALPGGSRGDSPS